jgi:hypothetical protein
MHARSLAMSGLLLATSIVARSESAQRPTLGLAVQLKPETLPSAALPEMKSELEALMATAGFHVEWLDSRVQSDAASAANIVVVDIRGACNASIEANTAQFAKPEPLAASSVVESHVLPFTWVDCPALTRFLSSSLANASPARRGAVLGRAIARLLAHEFYHVLAQTSDHTVAGIAKPSLSVADLLAGHFAFDGTALARFHHSPSLLSSSLYVHP